MKIVWWTRFSFGVAFAVAVDVALGVTFDVAFGNAFDVAFGNAFDFAFDVAFDVAVGVAFDFASDFAFGLAFSFSLTLIDGLLLGVVHSTAAPSATSAGATVPLPGRRPCIALMLMSPKTPTNK